MSFFSSNMYCFVMPKLEAGQMKLQSRLEEEEQDKAALMGRIQKLTKLILVSTKNSMPSSIPEKAGNRRRHSFGEDEVLHLAIYRRSLHLTHVHIITLYPYAYN